MKNYFTRWLDFFPALTGPNQNSHNRYLTPLFFAFQATGSRTRYAGNELYNMRHAGNTKQVQQPVAFSRIVEDKTAAQKKGIRKKINGDEVILYPYFNIFLKEIGAHLSNIEMSIALNDLATIQYDALALKAMLTSMNIPSGSRLADKLMEKAKENNAREVDQSLFSLKKLIAQLVHHLKQLQD